MSGKPSEENYSERYHIWGEGKAGIRACRKEGMSVKKVELGGISTKGWGAMLQLE